MKVFGFCLCIMLSACLCEAAYQNPTVLSNQRQSNGTVLITFSFAGNAGEPTVTRSYVVTQGTTATELRYWIDDTIKELDLVRTAETLPAIQPGQTVTKLARPASVTPAKQKWNQNYTVYLRAKDGGLTATTADVAALKAWLEANYQAGYLGETIP